MFTDITPFFFIGRDTMVTMINRLFFTFTVVALAFVMAACGGGGRGETDEKAPRIQLKARQTGDFSYDLNAEGNGIVITDYTGKGGEVIIPATIEDIPVMEIGENSFRGRSRERDALKPGDEITSVTIPEGVRIIGRGAFSDCRNLESVTLPDTVEEIREIAFRGCSSLRSINLPVRIRFIGLNAFFRNGELSDLSIPNGIRTIEWQGWNHFSGCGKLPTETQQRLKALGYPASF